MAQLFIVFYSRPVNNGPSASLQRDRLPGRVGGIDAARGFAGLIMIQGHAYDGWASPEAKTTVGYAVTRLFGTLPLPAFLLLAGAAVAWRVHVAVDRGENIDKVRRRVVARGLQIVVYGYVVNLVYALLDGYDSIETLLRADVLHVIGLSIAIVAALGIRGSQPRRRLALTAAILGVAVTLACPWLTSFSTSVEWGSAGMAVGPFLDVPGVTLMPFVPLSAWFAIGVGAGFFLAKARARSGDRSERGIPRRALLQVLGVGLGLSFAGAFATDLWVQHGADFSRSHPVIWMNVLDLGGRGLVVLGGGALAFDLLTPRLKAILLILGRGSLVAYVFHIPFCYGAFAQPLADRLSMLDATAFVILLMVVSTLAVIGRDLVRDRIAAHRTPA
ncbi:MAG: heparan-alpha-glucosaminide N-acetyltransferase domain-containing protein [Myxococcota bacterium]